MKGKDLADWPPLITDASRPRYIVWRDILLTTAAWLLVLWMAQLALLQIADEVWVLSGNAAFVPNPDWALWWRRLSPYGLVIGALAIWLLVWGVVARRRIRHYHYLSVPTPLPLAAEAARAGCSETTLAGWRAMRIAVVQLDADGHLIVTPRISGAGTAPVEIRP